MSMLGIQLNLRMGPTVAIPVPKIVIEALESVVVSQSDEGRSGFQLTFRVGRGPADIFDNPLLADKLVQANTRVIVTVIHNAAPRVLSDGLVTHQQVVPGQKPGDSKLVITGEDVSLAMDREEKVVEHPALPELLIVPKICLAYAQYGLIPIPVPPLILDPPNPMERIPVQRGTDLEYLKYIAGRYGYVFYVEPGPRPGINLAYWGPPVRIGKPQPPLTVNMGPVTNVKEIHFSYDSQKPVQVSGDVQDGRLNVQLPAQAFNSTRKLLSQGAPKRDAMRKVLAPPYSGQSLQQMWALAQGLMDASFDQVVHAKGEVDMLCYRGILEPRKLVGLRGAGREYDGTYYVKSVTHHIQKDSYRQSFEITREGPGALASWLPI